ncbi:hypothetical protein [Neorhizobium petrolearium]|uniref:hypothetical protein n=1 Tax=Neorhizobium petrolearium TaxID=515361 RepID=UPI003F813728
MAEDKKAQEAVEHAEKPTRISKRPAAGPHAKDRLTDPEKTPGTVSLPEPDAKETDAGPD